MTSNSSPYGSPFWFTYLANTSLMSSVSLLFRYSDFVQILGGTEFELGWIVGVGMIGSLLMRPLLGVLMDRYGTRRIWLFSILLIVVGLVVHLGITQIDFSVFLARMVYQTGLAGAFGAAMAFTSRRAPAARTAELIGVVGSAGFLGIMVGSYLSDFVCGPSPGTPVRLVGLFLIAIGLATGSFVFAWAATRGQLPPQRRQGHPAWKVLGRHCPIRIWMMAAVMGFGVSLPHAFLRPFVESLGWHKIGMFFAVYAFTAFPVRLATRRVPDRLGVRKTIFLGMASLVASMVFYLLVRKPWQLVLPAMAAGVAHALLYPAVVAGASLAFPFRHRGLATTLVMGMFDMGAVLGMPLAGSIVTFSRSVGWPAYPVMFLSVAGLLILATGVYSLGRREQIVYSERHDVARQRQQSRTARKDGGRSQNDSKPSPTTPANEGG